MKNRPNSKRFIFAVTILLLILSSWGCDKGECIDDPESCFNVIEKGGIMPLVEETESDEIGMAKDSVIDGDEWICETRRVSLTLGNEDFSLFNPNVEVIYPGNLLQGASLDNATPKEIVVARAGGTISHNLLNATQSFVEVDEVSLSKIRDAMRQLIRSSTNAAPANFSFSYEEVQSQEQLAFNMGVSVSNLAASVDADFSLEKSGSYAHYLVRLNQSYYTMNFDLPNNLSDIFAPGVTGEDLEPYIGNGNPATYISGVTYGRIFYMLIEAEESSQSIEAAINASFSNAVNEVEFGGGLSDLESLSSLKVKTVAFGGDASGTFEIIGETDLSTVRNALQASFGIENGVPLSYTVRNMADNQIVKVALATSYDVVDCEPSQPGLFDVLPTTTLNPSLNTPYTSLVGDVNGDGNDDVILNHKQGNMLQVQIALGDGGGQFDLGNVQEFSSNNPVWGSWTDYGVKLGDINGDGKQDLVWNNQIKENTASKTNNVTYMAMARNNGNYEFQEIPKEFPGTWRENYKFYVGDVDGDGRDDLIWNELNGQSNRLYTSLSEGQSLGKLNGFFDYKGGNFTNYVATLGDLNGDGRIDFYWEPEQGSPHNGSRVFNSIGQPDGSFRQASSSFLFGLVGWRPYDFSVGDIDGDGYDDVVMTKLELDAGANEDIDRYAVWMGFSSREKINSKELEYVNMTGEGRFYTLLGDIDRDGKSDLIWCDQTSTTNGVLVGLGNSNRSFSFPTGIQTHPFNTDWTDYDLPQLADINGDKRSDIIWINEGASLRIAMFVAKP